MSEKIKLLVTQEKFDELFSIDEWLNFDSLNSKQIYDKMLHFVVDQNNQPVSIEVAREMFNKVPKVEWVDYVVSFINSVSDAFVNPTNGSGSNLP